MKTIIQIADDVFKESGLKSTDYALVYTDTRTMYDIMYRVAKTYAQQCCDEQIERCAEEFEKDDSLSLCSTSAILNTPNVVTTK